MRYLRRNEEFAKLFRKFRLKSGIKSLIEFSELLVEEKYIYDVSLFAKWQSGERVPKDRGLLLAVVTVFLKEAGITSLEEVDNFFETVGVNGLTFQESEHLAKYLKSPSNKTLPPDPPFFLRNQNMLKAKTWKVMNHEHVLFYGMPGIGKTYLALHIANSLKKYFSDGIFWFHSDKIELENIFNTIFESFSLKHYLYKDKNEKLEKLHDKIIGKNILIIFDNISEENLQIANFFSQLPVAIIATATRKFNINSFTNHEVERFSVEEFEKLCISILGEAFFRMYKNQLFDLGRELEFLPITSSIFLRHIHKQPISVLDYKLLYEEHKKDLKMLSYDNKNLYIAIHLLYKSLPSNLQDILITASLFRERDFSLSTLSLVLKKKPQSIKKNLKELLPFSILEKINKNSFHLHSVVKDYLASYQSVDKFILLSDFYLKNIFKLSQKSEKLRYKFFQNNKQTLLWTVVNLSKLGAHDRSLELYESLREFLIKEKSYKDIYKTTENILPSFYKCPITLKRLQIFVVDVLHRLILLDRQKEAIDSLNKLKKMNHSILNKEIVSFFGFTTGWIYFEVGRYFASRTYFKPFLNRSNSLAIALDTLIKLKRKEVVFSEKNIDKVLSLSPYDNINEAQFFYVFGCIEVERSKFNNSVSYFEASYKFAKKNGDALYIYRSLEKLCYISSISHKTKKIKTWCEEFENFKDILL